jgi:hypothetical protein
MEVEMGITIELANVKASSLIAVAGKRKIVEQPNKFHFVKRMIGRLVKKFKEWYHTSGKKSYLPSLKID